MSSFIFNQYLSVFDDRLTGLNQEVECINRQKELLLDVGKTATLLGDLLDNNGTIKDANSLRVVTIGDNVATKFGRKGKIISIDFKQYKESGKFSDVLIEVEDLAGDVSFLDATRLI